MIAPSMSESFPNIVGMDDLAALGEFYRSAGKTVVSTNGCFDLLHAGHIGMLSRARALGDVLVVGLNDDASVRLLKGPGRPVVNQEDRAIMLASLKPVDHVVVFPGLLPNETLALLKPHIHCKAADYTSHSLPEAAVVRANGGRIEILPLSEGYGTSKLLSLASRAVGPKATAHSPEIEEELSEFVLATLLSNANLCRQSGYELAPAIAQAARLIDKSRRNGRTLWVFAEGTGLSEQVLVGMNCRMVVSGTLAKESAIVQATQTVPGDVAVAVAGGCSAEEVGFLSAAAARGAETILISSAATPQWAGCLPLVFNVEQPLAAGQTRLAILHGLLSAADHLACLKREPSV